MFRTTGGVAMKNGSVSDGHCVDFAEIGTCGGSGVPRSRFGFSEDHRLSLKNMVAHDRHD
jgi:hypothetical protein